MMMAVDVVVVDAIIRPDDRSFWSQVTLTVVVVVVTDVFVVTIAAFSAFGKVPV